MVLFFENSRHHWLQSSALEQTFALFLGAVTATAAIRVAMLVGDLRAPAGETWHRSVAHVRSLRGLLCLTLVAAAWFAALDWFAVLDTEFDHRARPMAVVVLTTWFRVATRLSVPLFVASMLTLAWIASDGLVRHRRGLVGSAAERER